MDWVFFMEQKNFERTNAIQKDVTLYLQCVHNFRPQPADTPKNHVENI